MRSTLKLVLAAAAVACIVAPLAGSTTPSPGAKLWGARFNSGYNKDDFGDAIAFAPDSSKVVATGTSVGATTANDVLTVAYSATGARLWAVRYDDASHMNDYAIAVAVTADRVYVLANTYEGSATDADFTTIAYNLSTGGKLWAAHYTGPGAQMELPQDIVVSPDGTRVYVTGVSPAKGRDDSATVAYDAATGAQLWANRYNPNGLSEGAYAIALNPAGTRVFITGSSHNSSGYTDFLTVALRTSDGQKVWAARYDGPEKKDDGGNDVAVSADGTKIVITGSSFRPSTQFDFRTLAYDAATGQPLWSIGYDDPAHGNDTASSLAVGGNKVFVTGTSYGGLTSQDDYETLAYSLATGHGAWGARWNGPGSNVDEPATTHALVVNAAATEVFVTGYTAASNGTNFDYGTVAYNAGTGAKLWASRYNGPAGADDFAAGIAASPDGTKVAVTGYSMGGSPGSPTNYDIATLAYQP